MARFYGFLETYRRAHPWWWRWLLVRDWFKMRWDWVLDRPYWDQGGVELRGLRTRRLIQQTVEDSVEILQGLE